MLVHREIRKYHAEINYMGKDAPIVKNRFYDIIWNLHNINLFQVQSSGTANIEICDLILYRKFNCILYNDGKIALGDKPNLIVFKPVPDIFSLSNINKAFTFSFGDEFLIKKDVLNTKMKIGKDVGILISNGEHWLLIFNFKPFPIVLNSSNPKEIGLLTKYENLIHLNLNSGQEINLPVWKSNTTTQTEIKNLVHTIN